MCDCGGQSGAGWKGWRPLPARCECRAVGDWIDLSHPLTRELPRVALFPKPVFEQIKRMPQDPMNVTRMEMVVHMGTHLDAPCHFFTDAPSLESVPLERLGGRGIVWPVEVGATELVGPHHLAGLEGRLQDGDILILDTGSHPFVGSVRYDDDHPTLSLAAADWIVDHGVKMLAVDTPTPDLSLARRTAGFDWPVHKRLLSNGVLIAEHLTNLAPLRGKTVEVFCGALNIVGGDGAPARFVARAIEE
ncbi:cyclase family protein [Enterovirga rhinocerotis]|uniref:Kynurenine formamidase n=1 Tax=Enterovirga rhinocerotis TaxID=1339210 RepID=A0A4R7C3W5_9HYPH|nr:cyclase family protein [Enterovirga rhinocerotis]TDR93190.1 kynurenine formamidase [Enterovirga rhinocerotis]